MIQLHNCSEKRIVTQISCIKMCTQGQHKANWPLNQVIANRAGQWSFTNLTPISQHQKYHTDNLAGLMQNL